MDAGSADASTVAQADAGSADTAPEPQMDATAHDVEVPDGDAPVSDAGPDGAGLEPVRVIRGDPAQTDWWDLEIRGAELDTYEGELASVRIGHPDRPPERLGSGQARIERGAFALSFPAVWEAMLYKQKRVFIDLDQNGRCDPQIDAVFADARAQRIDTLIVREGAASGQEQLPASRMPEADCAVFNAPWPAD